MGTARTVAEGILTAVAEDTRMEAAHIREATSTEAVVPTAEVCSTAAEAAHITSVAARAEDSQGRPRAAVECRSTDFRRAALHSEAMHKVIRGGLRPAHHSVLAMAITEAG